MLAKLIEGPTLNPEYNICLLRWSLAQKQAITPECEECNCDLMGKEVHETPTMWLCTACHDNHLEQGEPNYSWKDEREDFHSDNIVSSYSDD